MVYLKNCYKCNAKMNYYCHSSMDLNLSFLSLRSLLGFETPTLLSVIKEVCSSVGRYFIARRDTCDSGQAGWMGLNPVGERTRRITNARLVPSLTPVPPSLLTAQNTLFIVFSSLSLSI